MQIISLIYRTVFYQPLYNLLLFFAAFLPYGDLGLAIILVTIIARILLFPITHKTTVMQKKMKDVEPQIKKIQAEHKDNREKQGQLLMQLYREHGINPFSSIFLLFLQFPIFIALFHVFTADLTTTSSYVYSFISFPENINTLFLGFIDLTKPSLLLGFLAAVLQFIQLKWAMPPQSSSGAAPTPNPQQSMIYILPVMIFFFSAPLPFGWHLFPTLPAAAALYWTVNNLFAIVHEALVRRRAQRIIAA